MGRDSIHLHTEKLPTSEFGRRTDSATTIGRGVLRLQTMTSNQLSATLASPHRPEPDPPVAVSLALAVLVPFAFTVALQPALALSATALTVGYAVGRRGR